jgi:hypothetical protein
LPIRLVRIDVDYVVPCALEDSAEFIAVNLAEEGIRIMDESDFHVSAGRPEVLLYSNQKTISDS